MSIVDKFEIGKTYKCNNLDAWIAGNKENKDASKFLNDKLEIYLDPNNYVRNIYDHGTHIEHRPTDFSVFIEEEDRHFFTLVETSVSATESDSCLSEQSIKEAIKTLSQAAQELSTRIYVNNEGETVIYSNYHQDELKFDTAEKLLQHIKCVKQLDSFSNT